MKASIRQRRTLQIAAITKAAELDGLECTVKHIARCLGLKKTPHVYSLIRTAQTQAIVKVIAYKGQNDADQFLVVCADHPVYQGMDEMIASYRNESYS